MIRTSSILMRSHVSKAFISSSGFIIDCCCYRHSLAQYKMQTHKHCNQTFASVSFVVCKSSSNRAIISELLLVFSCSRRYCDSMEAYFSYERSQLPSQLANRPHSLPSIRISALLAVSRSCAKLDFSHASVSFAFFSRTTSWSSDLKSTLTLSTPVSVSIGSINAAFELETLVGDVVSKSP